MIAIYNIFRNANYQHIDLCIYKTKNVLTYANVCTDRTLLPIYCMLSTKLCPGLVTVTLDCTRENYKFAAMLYLQIK